MTINAIIKEAQIDETGAENVAEVSIKYGDFIGVTLEYIPWFSHSIECKYK